MSESNLPVVETLPVEAVETDPKPRLLSFTVVTGYLRGDHRKPYELHATGCRDLKKMMATQPSYEVAAVDAAHALDIAVDDMDGKTVADHYQVQPCTSPIRMRAAGRA